MKFLYDLMKDGVMSLSEQQNTADSASFSGGYAAMISGGLSQVNTVKMQELTLLFVLYQSEQVVKTSHTFLNCWTIPECTSNSAWAWKVMEYFSGQKVKQLLGAGMGLPGSSTADIKSWIAQKLIVNISLML